MFLKRLHNVTIINPFEKDRSASFTCFVPNLVGMVSLFWNRIKNQYINIISLPRVSSVVEIAPVFLAKKTKM